MLRGSRFQWLIHIKLFILVQLYSKLQNPPFPKPCAETLITVEICQTLVGIIEQGKSRNRLLEQVYKKKAQQKQMLVDKAIQWSEAKTAETKTLPKNTSTKARKIWGKSFTKTNNRYWSNNKLKWKLFEET